MMELWHGALAAFTLADPALKVAAVQALWQQRDALAIDTALELPAPQQPGRPPRPLLVHPKEVPRRSPYTPQGRASLVHAITHIEFNAIKTVCNEIYGIQRS